MAHWEAYEPEAKGENEPLYRVYFLFSLFKLILFSLSILFLGSIMGVLAVILNVGLQYHLYIKD